MKKSNKPKVLIFDLETSQLEGVMFDIWEQNIPFNNLHIPYRGQAVDFNAPHRDGTGAELKYLPSFVNLWNISDTISLEIALKGLTAKEKGGILNKKGGTLWMRKRSVAV